MVPFIRANTHILCVGWPGPITKSPAGRDLTESAGQRRWDFLLLDISCMRYVEEKPIAYHQNGLFLVYFNTDPYIYCVCFSRCFNPTSSLTHIMDGEKETQQHTQRYMHNGIHFPFFSKSFGSHYYRPYNALQNSLRTSHLPIYYSSTFCYRHISASSGMKASHVIRCQCSKCQGFRVMECG